jgi:hypothetical protein
MWSFHDAALNGLISPDTSFKMPCPPPVIALGSYYSRSIAIDLEFSIDSQHTDKAKGWTTMESSFDSQQ